jgi:hypothetical protein
MLFNPFLSPSDNVDLLNLLTTTARFAITRGRTCHVDPCVGPYWFHAGDDVFQLPIPYHPSPLTSTPPQPSPRRHRLTQHSRGSATPTYAPLSCPLPIVAKQQPIAPLSCPLHYIVAKPQPIAPSSCPLPIVAKQQPIASSLCPQPFVAKQQPIAPSSCSPTTVAKPQHTSPPNPTPRLPT